MEALQHIGALATLGRERTPAREASVRAKAAARSLGFTNAYFDRGGLKLTGVEIEQRKVRTTSLTEALGADELARLAAGGATMTEDEASALAMAL